MFEISVGERHPVNDADEILSNDDGTEVYAVHYADNGSVNVNFGYTNAVDFRPVPSGYQTQYDFDLFKESAK